MRRGRENQKVWNIILAAVCIILFAVLIILVGFGKRSEALETLQLEQESQEEKQTKEQLAAESALNNRDIVCWGDDMPGEDPEISTAMRRIIQDKLTGYGYEIGVQDKTLQGAGTLTFLKMAGVPEETIQNYVNVHQENGGEETAPLEVEIRELSPEQLERNDAECIPVLCMGYYGGWNHDPNELADQIQQILTTFSNQEEYVIVGAVPGDGSVDPATYDAVMTERFGAHYISMGALTAEPAESAAAQEAAANAVITKLEELGYISLVG